MSSSLFAKLWGGGSLVCHLITIAVCKPISAVQVVQAVENMASGQDDGCEASTSAYDPEGTLFAEENTFFPDDILAKIMLCVGKEGGFKSLCRCMEVCKQWKHVAESAVSSVVWSRAISPLRCAEGTFRYKSLHMITMDHCFAGRGGWSPVFEALGMARPHLESLHMLEVQPPLTTGDLISLFSNCRLLNDVRFVRALKRGATLPVHLMASLKHIRIEGTYCGQFSEPMCLQVDLLTRLTTLLLYDLPLELQLSPFGDMTSLRHLSLAHCHQLPRYFPPLVNLPALEVLDFDNCQAIDILLSVFNLQKLHTLILNSCWNLKEIRGIETLTQLRVLDLFGCDRLNDIPALATFRHIEKLSLNIYSETRASWVLEWLPQLTNLRFLALFILDHVAIHILRLPCCLRHLQIIEAWDGYNDPITTSMAIEGPKNLQFLQVKRTVCLESAAFQSLRTISLTSFSDDPTPFLPLDSFQNLQVLSMEEEGIEVAGAFWDNMPQTLTAFQLTGNVHVLPTLNALSGLCHLELQLSVLRVWPRHSLKQLRCLRSLVLKCCASLETIPDLDSLTLLEVLKLEICSVRKLPPLGTLKNLEEVSLERLNNLRKLPAVDGLTSLKRLHVEECNVSELPSLDGLTALREICLRKCHALEGLPPLTGLAQLQALDLYGCTLLKGLPPLDGLTRLLWLDLRGCGGLPTGGPGGWVPAWQGAHESLQVFYRGQEGGAGLRFSKPPNGETDIFPSFEQRWRSLTVDGSEGVF